jgi:hypothetical protein
MKKKYTQGFALYFAIIITSLLLMVAYATVNLSIKELQLSVEGSESQISIYAADTGVECALYWDTRPGSPSAFDASLAGSVNCAGTTVTTGSQTVQTTPSRSSVIGATGFGTPSIFQINLSRGCAIVTVIKNADGTTNIESRGYNTCASGVRFERGIKVTY